MELSFPPCKEEKPYIFVWYAKEDEAKAIPLLETLHFAGYRLSYHKTPLGSNIMEVIAKRISKCAVFMPLLSHEFCNSDDCHEKTAYAHAKGKKIVPVYLEKEIELPFGLDMILNPIQDIRVFNYKSAEHFALALRNEEAFIPCYESGECHAPTNHE